MDENKLEGMINEEDLNKQAENIAKRSVEQKSNSVDKEIYRKKEEEKAEQAIERSNKKLQQKTATQKDDDSRDNQVVNIDDVEKHIDEMKKLDVDDQIGYLMQIATGKDPILAISIAKHLNDNYILDELHSDLTEDKIRKVLIEKKLF